ncbi:MAG: hypothetical protein EBZ66_03960, partial [Actinobacteria bacterium]|nr:hypothetical protein [Actinomycetota bacterium]
MSSHRAEVIVDLGAIDSNIKKVIQDSGKRVLAVVKADAYGHGLVPIAQQALKSGASWLGTALLEEALGEGTRLEHAHAGPQAVLAPEFRQFGELVEIGIEVHRRPEALRELRRHEVVEARHVGVELRVILERHEVLVRHLSLQAVHLAVGEARLGQRRHVLLGIEAARRAPVLRIAGVPMRPVPAERC